MAARCKARQPAPPTPRPRFPAAALPTDILKAALTYESVQAHSHLCAVSREWKELSTSDLVWRPLYRTRFAPPEADEEDVHDGGDASASAARDPGSGVAGDAGAPRLWVRVCRLARRILSPRR